jgi:hypothetical protein
MANDDKIALTSDALASYRPSAPTHPSAPKSVDMFVQGAVLGRAIYAVIGSDGIAAVTSPSDPSRPSYLFWSHQAEAERWADALVADPRVVAIDLPSFLSTTAPAMRAADALAGIDWNADSEVELEAAALAVHLREELVREFAVVAFKTRTVWMLQNAAGIAGIIGIEGGRVTPLWADRHLAEACIQAVGDPELIAVRKPLLELTSRYLLSPEGLKAQLAPGYVHAAGVLTLSPWALKALLNGGGRPTTRIAAVA